jgi:hypothetical protein
MRSWITLLIAGSLCCVADGARADRVILATGSVLEGKATRVGEKVVVEVEAGRLTLSAGSVARIEPGEAPTEKVDERAQALAPNDVDGLIKLADYCRDHDMHAREQDLLRKVLAVAPDHPEARARLGYVRTETGWVTQDAHMRAQGMIKRDGRWLTPEQLLALQRLEAQTRVAQLERDKAQLEVERQRMRLAGDKADQAYLERQREREQNRPPQSQNLVSGVSAYYSPFGYGGTFAPPFLPWPNAAHAGQAGGGPGMARPNPNPLPGPGPAPVPYGSIRDPHNTGGQIPGFNDPRSYF